MKVLKVPRWLFLSVITNRNGGLTLMQFWGKLKVKPN